MSLYNTSKVLRPFKVTLPWGPFARLLGDNLCKESPCGTSHVWEWSLDEVVRGPNAIVVERSSPCGPQAPISPNSRVPESPHSMTRFYIFNSLSRSALDSFRLLTSRDISFLTNFLLDFSNSFAHNSLWVPPCDGLYHIIYIFLLTLDIQFFKSTNHIDDWFSPTNVSHQPSGYIWKCLQRAT